MPEIKQMNDCLERVQREIKLLKERRKSCKEKMDVAIGKRNAIQTASMITNDDETEAWRKEKEISIQQKIYSRWNIERMAIDIKLKVLRDIERSTQSWNVRCC